tara:strand:- start:4145 stop:4315 length:171 start_codon:yes stop_codon:yes gene_type:complete
MDKENLISERILKLSNFYNLRHPEKCLDNLTAFYNSVDNILEHIAETEPLIVFKLN